MTRQPSEFDVRTVCGVVAILKEYARKKNLGPPPEIVVRPGLVGVKWSATIGHGVGLDDTATEATIREILRRLEAWQQQGVTA